MSFAHKKYWVIGASEGLGRALSVGLAREGAEMIVSARNEARLRDLLLQLPATARALPFDVTDKAAVAQAVKDAGVLDGVIYAAGTYWPMAAGAWDQEAVEVMIETNFTGAARCLGPVVRDFAARDQGHIVVIGSLSGFRGLRGAIGYGASKAGVMHLAENIQADLHRTNVKVQLINPGFIKTRLTDKNDFAMPFIMTPEQAAQEVIEDMKSNRFQSNFPRPFSWLFRGGNFLPAPLFFRIFGAKE
ncbi:MAG: SDR family NAD(P)-dependent oxidoreductase [Pseudomonadota bacterium]